MSRIGSVLSFASRGFVHKTWRKFWSIYVRDTNQFGSFYLIHPEGPLWVIGAHLHNYMVKSKHQCWSSNGFYPFDC